MQGLDEGLCVKQLPLACPLATRPTCLFCEQPLKPYLRRVHVKVEAGEDISVSQVLARAGDLIRGLISPRPAHRMAFVSCDTGALHRVNERIVRIESIAVSVWVHGDYQGSEYIDDRPYPCFCKPRCAVEFARLAAATGFRARRAAS